MSFQYDQFRTREGNRRMNELLDEVIAEVKAKRKAVFDSADDLCIQPDTEDCTPYTTEQLISDCKLAMLFKSPRQRRQIAKDCKVIKRQLEEEQDKELAKAAERETNNRLQLVCNSGNQAYDSAYRRLKNIFTEYHNGIAVRTFRENR